MTYRDPDRDGRCRGHNRSGARCQLDAVHGAVVCHKHGAAVGTPARRAADQRVQAEEISRQMRRATVTYGLPLDIDPGTALLEEIQRTAGHIAWLKARVEATPERRLFPGGKPSPILQMYNAERAHYAKISADAVRCGLEARHLQILEQQAELMLEVLRRFAGDLGFDPNDPRVMSFGVTRLRELSTAG